MDVRSAIHVRTGPRAFAEALDAWLLRERVAVTAFDDVYDACGHLLRHYDRIPDLVLIGGDQLLDDEANLVAYFRQTWPRTGVVVYGETQVLPLLDLLPMVRACRGADALHELLAETPTAVVRRLCDEAAPIALTPVAPRPADQAAADPPACGTVPARPPEGEAGNRGGSATHTSGRDAVEPLHAILTPEELEALLGTREPP